LSFVDFEAKECIEHASDKEKGREDKKSIYGVSIVAL
jgi:hypothetical protein